MLAVEFSSTVQNGKIQIPQQYIHQVGKKVRVIILTEDMPVADQEPDFSALSINTKGYKFSREDANER